jgi:hypothetical protein
VQVLAARIVRPPNPLDQLAPSASVDDDARTIGAIEES